MVELERLGRRYLKAKLNKGLIRISKREFTLGKQGFIESLATKRYAGERLFEKDPEAPILAWIRSQKVAGFNKRRAIETNLKRYKGAGVRIGALRNPCIKIKYAGGVSMLGVKEVAKIITEGVRMQEEIEQWMVNGVRVVTTNDASIQGTLVNNRNYAKHKFFRCSEMCKGENHFGARMAECKGVIGKVGKISANFIPADSGKRAVGNVIKGLIEWTERIIAIKEAKRFDSRMEGYTIRDEDKGSRLRMVCRKRLEERSEEI